MTRLLWVGIGGFLGAVLRFVVAGAVQRLTPLSAFPYGTVAVNLIGCLLIGVLSGLVESRQLFNPQLRLFLTVGLLGSFTTFSTFGYESLILLREGGGSALAYIALHLAGGLAAVWLGLSLARLAA